MTRPLRDPDTPPRLDRRLVNVMIVDDAVVVRGLMSRWLNEHPRFNVVACARNGRVALEELERGIQPDIVILDLDMPEVDGLTALPLILRKCPTAAVLVASTLTRRNAEISLRCLSLGALDYLPKPETNREVTTSLSFRQELVLKLEALAIARGLVSRPGDAPDPRALGRVGTPEPAQQASQRRRAGRNPCRDATIYRLRYRRHGLHHPHQRPERRRRHARVRLSPCAVFTIRLRCAVS